MTPSRESPAAPVRRAFVLSGGASLGAQVGMLRALFEREPDLIVGTSAGAINGAYVASRGASPETTDSLGEIWKGLRRSDIFPANPITASSASSAAATTWFPTRASAA
jgi:NTE family protein